MEAVQEGSSLDDLSCTSESVPPAQSEDVDSMLSSRSVSVVSFDDYEYNPNDFPRQNEIEEFQSPSFFWPPSTCVSGRQSSVRSTSIQYSKNWPKKLAGKLQTGTGHLRNLLLMSEVPGAVDFDNPETIKVIVGAQESLDKASGHNTPNLKKDWDEMVEELETAATNISAVLPHMKLALARLIQLADLVATISEKIPVRYSWYRECQELKSKSQRLARVLWLAAYSDVYERPLSYIVIRVEETLLQAAEVAKKHRNTGNIASYVFIKSSLSHVNYLMKILVELEECIIQVSWFIRLCNCSSPCPVDPKDVDSYIGVPRFTVENPILCSIWEAIATLLSSYPEGKVKAAESLMSLAGNKDQYGKMIIEEGGEEPLLKLVQEEGAAVQEIAIKAVGFLCRNLDNAMMLAGNGSKVCSVLVSVLNGGRSSIQVQANTALAISQLAAHYTPGSRFTHLTLTVEPLVKYLIDFAICDDTIIHFVFPNVTRALHMLVNYDIPQLTWEAFDKKIFFRLFLHVPLFIGRGTQKISRKCCGDFGFMVSFFDEMNRAAASWKSPNNQLLEIVNKAEYNNIEPLVYWTTEAIRSLVWLLKSQAEERVLEAFIVLTKFTHEYYTLHKIKNRGVPPIAFANPITCVIWQAVARIKSDLVVDAAATWLMSLADHDDQYGKSIIDQGGVEQLLKLAKQGKAAAQESAIKALGFLGRDLDNAKKVLRYHMPYFVLAYVLEHGPIKAKANAACAVSQLASHHSLNFGNCYKGSDQSNIEYLINQLLEIVSKAAVDYELLLLCIEALGCLSLICTTIKVIVPLVRLLDRKKEDIVLKAVAALTKFTSGFFSPQKYCMKPLYCEVIAKEGAKYISQLVYQGHAAQKPALMLACSVAAQVRDNHELNNMITWAYIHNFLGPEAT